MKLKHLPSIAIDIIALALLGVSLMCLMASLLEMVTVDFTRGFLAVLFYLGVIITEFIVLFKLRESDNEQI